MDLESSPSELLVIYSTPFLSSKVTKQQSQQAIRDYYTLSLVSKSINAAMHTIFSGCLFVKNIHPTAFCRETHPSNGRDWQEFIKHGFRVLSNMLNEKPEFSYKIVPNRKYQAISGDDQAVLLSYDSTKKAIVRSIIDSDASEEVIPLEVELKSPGKQCVNFIACDDNFWAINEGDSTVSLFNKKSGKLHCRLEDLGQVYQLEMHDNFLYLLVHDNEGMNNMLRFDTRNFALEKSAFYASEKLSLPSNHCFTRFFILDNRVCFQESEGIRFRLWSLALPPGIALKQQEKKLEWVSSNYFSSSSKVVRADDGFIICRQGDFNLQRLSFKDKEFVYEELKESIPLKPSPTRIAELYYHCGKLFIFYCTADHYNVITYDCENNNIGKKDEFPFTVLPIGLNNILAFHSSAEKINFIYPCRQATEENRSLTSNMAVIDYGAVPRV